MRKGQLIDAIRSAQGRRHSRAADRGQGRRARAGRREAGPARSTIRDGRAREPQRTGDRGPSQQRSVRRARRPRGALASTQGPTAAGGRRGRRPASPTARPGPTPTTAGTARAGPERTRRRPDRNATSGGDDRASPKVDRGRGGQTETPSQRQDSQHGRDNQNQGRDPRPGQPASQRDNQGPQNRGLGRRRRKPPWPAPAQPGPAEPAYRPQRRHNLERFERDPVVAEDDVLVPAARHLGRAGQLRVRADQRATCPARTTRTSRSRWSRSSACARATWSPA